MVVSPGVVGQGEDRGNEVLRVGVREVVEVVALLVPLGRVALPIHVRRIEALHEANRSEGVEERRGGPVGRGVTQECDGQSRNRCDVCRNESRYQ